MIFLLHIILTLFFFVKFHPQKFRVDTIKNWHGVIMQVDLVKRHCFPVYWNGENRRVLRGHWFARKGGLDWLPLREDVAEQLEIAYRSQVCTITNIYFFDPQYFK
jgi:hypothetical protein